MILQYKRDAASRKMRNLLDEMLLFLRKRAVLKQEPCRIGDMLETKVSDGATVFFLAHLHRRNGANAPLRDVLSHLKVPCSGRLGSIALRRSYALGESARRARFCNMAFPNAAGAVQADFQALCGSLLSSSADRPNCRFVLTTDLERCPPGGSNST